MRHTPLYGFLNTRELSPPKHDVTEGFMAFRFSQKQAPCIGLHESGLQRLIRVMVYAIFANGTGILISRLDELPNKLFESEMSKLKLWSD